MKTNFKRVVFLLLPLIFSLSGCNMLDYFERSKIVHDELFTYDMHYDKAYLKVLDAVSDLPNWYLTGTDKQNGIIRVEAKKFTRDTVATVIIKRIDNNKVSVELAPDSQNLKGVEEILKAIDKAMLTQ